LVPTAVRRYVIVGAGVAGMTAAMAIRRLDPEGTVTVLTDEEHPFYARIRLPELLSGSVTPEQLVLKRPQWYERNRIELRTGETAVDVEVAERVVGTSKGARERYDALLLATGGRANVPPIEGADMPGVFTLRTMADALAIRARVGAGGRRVCVIGGGVLGLEASYHMMRAGNSVEVIEFQPRLLPRQTDPEASAIFQRRLESLGLEFHLNGRSKAIIGGGAPEAVVLEDGRRVACDTVLISAGVRPTVKLATRLGLRIERGIVVDDRMRTGVPDVYAAGDLIEHRGVTYGIWPPAERQGEVAGTNMALGEASYEGSTISNVLKVVGVDLFAAGDIDAAGIKQSIIVRESARGIYRKLVLDDDGRIAGAILLGDVTDQRRVLRTIETRREVRRDLEALARWDLSCLDAAGEGK
jgi:nitrite reductase (NADH) large subunit